MTTATEPISTPAPPATAINWSLPTRLCYLSLAAGKEGRFAGVLIECTSGIARAWATDGVAALVVRWSDLLMGDGRVFIPASTLKLILSAAATSRDEDGEERRFTIEREYGDNEHVTVKFHAKDLSEAEIVTPVIGERPVDIDLLLKPAYDKAASAMVDPAEASDLFHAIAKLQPGSNEARILIRDPNAAIKLVCGSDVGEQVIGFLTPAGRRETAGDAATGTDAAEPSPMAMYDDASTPAASDDPDAWKREPITVLRLSPGVLQKLQEAEIDTLGKFSALGTKHGTRWHRDIKGIGDGAAEKINDAFQAWFMRWDAARKAATAPDEDAAGEVAAAA